MATENVFTYVLNGGGGGNTLSIVERYGLSSVSFVLKSGTGSYIGSLALSDGITSISPTSIPLSVDSPVTVTSPTSSGSLAFSITADAGAVIDIIAIA